MVDMSTLGFWSYAEGPCTVWPMTGTDAYGQPVYGAPLLIARSDYIEGGETRRDLNGEEFTPKITVYFEIADDAAALPERGWRLALGDLSGEASPPDGAEIVRTVKKYPAEKFGEGELPDWEVTC